MQSFWSVFWLGRLLWLGLLAAGLWVAASWLHLPVTPGLDGILGVVTLLWLLFTVTVPWNMYFQAKQVMYEAQVSRTRGITVDPEAFRYAQRWSRIALGIAIGLHVLTTLVLCGAAWSGVGFMGWFGAGASIVLTVLRPGVRAYAHVRDRLNRLVREIEVPREDAVDLRRRVAQLEHQLADLGQQHAALAERNAQQLQGLDQRATEGSDRQTAFAEHMRLELVRVERDAKNTVAQVLGDAAVVGHVRELVRFFKQA